MLTAAEARKQQIETAKKSSDISEILAKVDEQTRKPGETDTNYIYWYKTIHNTQKAELEKLGYTVTKSPGEYNSIDWKISWPK